MVSSLISSINNATIINKPSISFPHSKISVGILSVLLEEGFIHSFEEKEERKNIKSITINLKYIRGKSSIQDLKVVSTPGKRVYSSPNSITPHYDSLGFYIFSTSKGIMTDSNARALNAGGEILCKVF